MNSTVVAGVPCVGVSGNGCFSFTTSGDNLVHALSLLNKPIPPISMHCDSQIAISKVTSKILMKKEDT